MKALDHDVGHKQMLACHFGDSLLELQNVNLDMFILGSSSIPSENWNGNLVGISMGIKISVFKKAFGTGIV